jgi:methylated-DNA-[protein]-cysteine S-methyltransferase
MPYAAATARIATPIGIVELVAEGSALTSCRILPQESAEMQDLGNETLDQAITQMRDWFAGKRQDFDLPLLPLTSPRGEALRAGIVSVPYGQTLTYGGLAAQIGSAPRAVGQACKRNPFPIIVPCHRVTTAAGPENYSGGAGVVTKAWLLDFEQTNFPPDKRTRLL